MPAWICRKCGGAPAGGQGLRPCPEHPDQILVDLDHFETHGKYEWLGRSLGDRYGLFQFLGGGGFGQAFCALDMQLLRPVAVKIFRPMDGALADASMQARFYREARLLAQLNDPNIVTVHDLGVHTDVPYFAMEWIDGDPWNRALQGVGPTEVLSLFNQVLAGLATAHAAGIIHRDIKPANIMVTADRTRAILIDFGIAKPEHETNPLTEAGMVMGTLQYMAPEIKSGHPASPRSDVYAVGMLLAALVPPNANPELRAIVRRATDVEPTHRYQSAREMATDLRRVGARLDLPTTRLQIDASDDAHAAPTISAVASRIAQIRVEAAERTPLELRPRETRAVPIAKRGDDRPTRINTAEHTALQPELTEVAPPPRGPDRRWMWWAAMPALAALGWIFWPTASEPEPVRMPPVVATVAPGTIASVAPETAAPETAAPQSAAPQTAAPQSAAPQTAAPQSAAPQTAAPETAAPRTAAPQTAAPQARPPAPATRAPKAKRPRLPRAPKVSGTVREEIFRLVNQCQCFGARTALRRPGTPWRDADDWRKAITDHCRAEIAGQCNPPPQSVFPR